MMSVVLPVLVMLAAAVLAVPDEQKYSTKYDNVSVKNFLKNERLLTKAFQCLMDQGGCTADVLELKKHLPDALQNGCSKCSDKQKAGAQEVFKYLIENKRDHFDQLEKKYDPTGIYRKQYKDLAEKEGIKV